MGNKTSKTCKRIQFRDTASMNHDINEWRAALDEFVQSSHHQCLQCRLIICNIPENKARRLLQIMPELDYKNNTVVYTFIHHL